MKSSFQNQSLESQVSVFECEIKLQFRIIEEQAILQDPDQLIEMLIEAFACGGDEFIEALGSDISVENVPETNASPNMRRQLMRLRNAKWMT